ncbi:MAG: hypothetical protein V7780_06795 [Colwellia sp.]|jgi:hypothetical protein
MKCPHCKQKLGFFSKTLSAFGKIKICSNCEKKIKIAFNFKLIMLLVIPVFLLHSFLLKPLVIILGFSGNGIVGIWGGILVILTMQLKSAETVQPLPK